MISFVTGKPGDGKSLYAMRVLVRSLVSSDACVVTNIPVKLPELRAYVVARRPDFDLDERLRVLDDDDVREFFRFRSGGLILDESPDSSGDGKRMERDAFRAWMKAQFLRMGEREQFQRPVHYYIDEVHDFFSARDWATNGRATLFYASKHRHLRDEVVLITQVIDNVEKQLRTLVSETYVVRNFIRRNVGVVKMRPIFRVKQYYGVPSQGSVPFQTRDYPLDAAGLAACYRTVGALGVHKEPEEIRNKGVLPWWSLWLGGFGGVALLMLAIFFAPRVMAGGLVRLFRRPVPARGAAAASVPRVSSPVVAGSVPAGVARSAVAGPRLEFEGELRQGAGMAVFVVDEGWEAVRGIALDGGVLLADGREAYQRAYHGVRQTPVSGGSRDRE